MRALAEREVVIQIWSSEFPNGDGLCHLIQKIIDALKEDPRLGVFVELEGPTPHLPDYFSDLYGTVVGWLIYMRDTNPQALKRLLLTFELEGSERIADIDVFTSYFDKVSRKDLLS